MEELLNYLEHYEQMINQTIAEKETYPALLNYLQGELHAIERTKSFVVALTTTQQL